MSQLDKKKKILEAGIQKQQSIIMDFKNRIEVLQESEVVPNEDDVDLQQSSLNDQANELTAEIADQLSFANNEMETLYKIIIEEPLHEVASFGSVVETDKLKFFISVSLEEFEAGGVKYFGISTHAPIYAKMKGLKDGDSFDMNGMVYKIDKVY